MGHTKRRQVLEDILQTVRSAQERKAVEEAVAEYYSALSLEEVSEQAAWGEFALGEFARHLAGRDTDLQADSAASAEPK